MAVEFPHEKARRLHLYQTEQYKLDHGIQLNIYDAARSYRSKEGLDVGLRAILRNDEFREAWRTFKGGDHYQREGSHWVKTGHIKGGRPTSFTEKMDAADTLGWTDETQAIERLRSVSP